MLGTVSFPGKSIKGVLVEYGPRPHPSPIRLHLRDRARGDDPQSDQQRTGDGLRGQTELLRAARRPPRGQRQCLAEVSRGTITVIRRFAELIRGSTARPRPISFCGAQVQDHGTRLDRIGAVASIGKLNARGKRIGIGLDRLHLTRGKELGRGAVSFCGNDGNKMGKISY